MSDPVPLPALKTPGGKRRILNRLREFFPMGPILSYCEPFLGGGVVALDILDRYEPHSVLLNDNNLVIIETHRAIAHNLSDLLRTLVGLVSDFEKLTTDESREAYYYRIRDAFNTDLPKVYIKFVQAARFLFLNHTCFNGLVRFNSEGKFNVAYGFYQKPHFPLDILPSISELLRRADILHGDYRELSGIIPEESFVYCDPPYRKLTNTTFDSYKAGGFTDDNRAELADFLHLLTARGCQVMLSESDLGDGFFEALYPDFHFHRLRVSRAVSSNVAGRAPVTELVLTNYSTPVHAERLQ